MPGCGAAFFPCKLLKRFVVLAAACLGFVAIEQRAAAQPPECPLPAGALARLGSLRFRHQHAVVQVAFARDGKRLASASLDGTVRVWETATGKELHRFAAQVGLSRFPWFGGQLVFGPGGKTLVLARNDLYAWDLKTGKEISDLVQDTEDYLAAHCAGGQVLTAFRRGGSVVLVDALAHKELRRFDNAGNVTFACLSPDGRTLLTAGSDKGGRQSLRFWEIASGKQRQPAQPVEWFHAAAFAPDGKTLALTGDDGVRVLAWPSGKQRYHVKMSAGALTYSSDGKLLAVGDNQTAHLLDAATGKTLQSFVCYQWIEALALSPDGKTLAVATGSTMHRLHPTEDSCGGVVHLFDTATGQPLGPQEAHQSVATCVGYAPGGTMLASGSRDRTVRLWDPVSGKQLAVLAGHDKEVLAVAFAPGGKLLASGGRGGAILLWDVATRKKVRALEHGGDVYNLAFSADGLWLAAAGGTMVRLWDMKTAKELHHWEAEKNVGVYAVAFAPDGKTLAWAGGQRVFLPDSGGNSIHLVDPETGKDKSVLPGKNGDFAVCSLAYAPGGEFLAAGQMNPYLNIWQPATGKLLHRLNFPAAGTVTFGPGGKLLASTHPAGDITYLIDPAKGLELRQISSQQGGVYAVAFAPDGRSLASAGQDGTILIWEVDTRRK